MERDVPSCPRSLLPRMPPVETLKEKPCTPALWTGVISTVRQHKKRTFFQMRPNAARRPEGSPAGPVVVGRRGPVRAWPVRPSPLQPHAILGPLGRAEHRRPHLLLQHCPRQQGSVVPISSSNDLASTFHLKVSSTHPATLRPKRRRHPWRFP